MIRTSPAAISGPVNGDKKNCFQKILFIALYLLPMTTKPSIHIYWLDALKAIGLFFVVLGHNNGIGASLFYYIYSFHIPLFFFISGYLIKPESLTHDFSRIWRRHFQSLILPYFTFGAITYLLWLLAGRFYGKDLALSIHPVKPLVGMLYGIGEDYWLRHNTALWFFPALFSLHLIFYWLRRLCNDLGLAYAVILLSLVSAMTRTFLPFRLPWGIEWTCTGLMFYWAGYLLRTLKFDLRQIKPLWRCLTLTVCLAIQIAGIQAKGRIDLNSIQLGNVVAFYIAAFSGILFWILISQVLPTYKVISTIARESLIIFPLHTLCFSTITFLGGIALQLPPDFRQGSSLAAASYTILTFAVLIPAAPWIRRALPWLKR